MTVHSFIIFTTNIICNVLKQKNPEILWVLCKKRFYLAIEFHILLILPHFINIWKRDHCALNIFIELT